MILNHVAVGSLSEIDGEDYRENCYKAKSVHTLLVRVRGVQLFDTR